MDEKRLDEKRLDEKRLDELEKEWRHAKHYHQINRLTVVNFDVLFETVPELIRLARLGLWSEKAIETLFNIAAECTIAPRPSIEWINEQAAEALSQLPDAKRGEG